MPESLEISEETRRAVAAIPPQRWRPAPDFAGYFVSEYGDVAYAGPPRDRGAYRTNYFLAQRVATPVGTPYAYVGLFRDGRQHQVRVHRLILRAFEGEPPTAQHQAAHRDGDSLNNWIGNLYWATPKENRADSVAHGRVARGDDHPMRKHPELVCRGERVIGARLTEATVRIIRESPLSAAALARVLGVGASTVKRVRQGLTWRHVQ